MRDKQYEGYIIEDGIYINIWSYFFFFCILEGIILFNEDEKVKVFFVVLVKDAMQIKLGLLYDVRQGKIIGSIINIDYKFVRDNFELDIEMLKKIGL